MERSSEATVGEEVGAEDEQQRQQRQQQHDGLDPDDTASQHASGRPGLFKRLWTKAGLDLPTLMMMLKGAIAPTIALAAYESDAWAREYSTLGYLSAIMTTLTLPILPRGKFLQNLLTATFAVCLGAAMTLLTIRCTVAARESRSRASQEGTSGSQEARSYSTAANATAVAWLFFNLWFANTLRAARPQLMIVSILYTIFMVVALTYAPKFTTMAVGMAFVKRLLKTFLTGFALSTGVSLFILPVSSRMVCQKQMAGVLNLLKTCISIHNSYLQQISAYQQEAALADGKNGASRGPADSAASAQQAQALSAKLKTTLHETSNLFGMLKIEIGFAKKEIGFGKLRPEDFSMIWVRIQQIFLPIAGLSTFADILETVRRHKVEGEDLLQDAGLVDAIHKLEADEWHEVVAMSREPFTRVKASLADGIAHAQYVLELVPRPKTSKIKDLEKNADAAPAPGDPKFAEHLKAEIKLFEEHREGTMRRWCEKKGIDVPAKFWEDPSAQYNFEGAASLDETIRNKHNHQQLYLILYLEYLLYSICLSILDLVVFADSKVQDGTMSKMRLIFPGWRRIKNLFKHMFTQEDSEPALPDGDATGVVIWPGESVFGNRDPEHLPPTNLYQRMTDYLRAIPRVLGSDASSFGFRAAVASVSIAILGYLRPTHTFYNEQRGVWAVIMVAISMGPTAGAGVQGFLFRIGGTVIAMVVSIAIWYMGDQKPAAIIPLLYIAIVCGFYVVLKKQKYLISGVISIVTLVLIVGYELQDLKIGTKLLTSNGQKYYHIYVLAPYRLATVVIGLTVAFIWTYLPYPVTTRSTLRKDLGSALYLLGNYYACTHSNVEMKLRLGAHADDADKNSPMRKLDKARIQCFTKMLTMLNKLRQHSDFIVYEPTFGGKFPKQTYDGLIVHLQSLFNYMALINYSSQAFVTRPDRSGDLDDYDDKVPDRGHPMGHLPTRYVESEWLSDFRRLTAEAAVTNHELTSIICLVAASISNSQPLPPYVRVPPPIHLADQLSRIDPGILSVQHINEPCYAAFAVLEIASVLIMQETTAVLAKVKELVGEVDFSLHMSSSTDTSSSSLPNGKGKAD
ncbi:hypothetical protein PV08_01746 [Exophiala spinifera]|uniref:ER transporter 6TM N-terminal domain-containing protein n=1 Tax=Exophiala spinifera TaxID=91928 RepID=A0A0D1Z0N0_9EURO|nr:uncharacterized protein PV08_01746 [Exophiala spinifera]KIW21166.1 hypothetical protein PV08_01746 [Exophiala spinifera]